MSRTSFKVVLISSKNKVDMFHGYHRYQASLGAPDTSVELQRVNNRICVAMMVFAPIYVAQMI